mmetsp:Transcript_94009/g.235983  ORF Transcript_94009/g.235983 Transcript_94009/m.235983 type:complete len:323 (+) Transcript_94009:90-1058(+)|eukprot:CAMPEP_0115271130 /NCGR_PEP_ID=MMETSP0270-20121206/53933_1 /TAXON_ID=71861 /ORGANISM="Scrippsiella trochoidea, Strain CCMP3099" /LENGTH=322 /DNA_ID=CAMNT_0002687465 /DNA_START=78 /DNA_END=1046 /DNA_ORIENTATION=-
MEAIKYSTPVGELVGLDWGVLPVQNTFIHFDFQTRMPAARNRSVTCPCSSSHRAWENAMQEICHAMTPAARTPDVADAADAGHDTSAHDGIAVQSSDAASREVAATSRCAAAAEAEVDKISEVSTTSSERGNTEPTKDEVSPPSRWSAVSTRSQRRANTNRPSRPSPQTSSPPTPVSKAGSPVATVTTPQSPSKGSGKGGSKGKGTYDSPSHQCDGGHAKGEGKGKGLQHFCKLEVGIDDDPNFRVVSRLIGPKGRHMQDILSKAKGSKIWIIGKGSRSWEDDVGPLVVCIGATSAAAYETAVASVKDLLARVTEDHRKFGR